MTSGSTTSSNSRRRQYLALGSIGLQLLAYFNGQAARPDIAANTRAYLQVVMADEVFSRDWLYDNQRGAFLQG